MNNEKFNNNNFEFSSKYKGTQNTLERFDRLISRNEFISLVFRPPYIFLPDKFYEEDMAYYKNKIHRNNFLRLFEKYQIS
jgi:hypothetical protein